MNSGLSPRKAVEIFGVDVVAAAYTRALAAARAVSLD
jgi:hypothetical protein